MNLLGAKINEPPNNLRAILSIGSFLKSVLDHADKNARAKVEMGQEPDLLEDVMAGGKIHIPQLEEIVAEFAGRTTATKMVDFMMQTHSVIGLLDNLLENVKHGDPADAQSHPPGSTRPGATRPGASSPGFRPSSGQAANSSNGAEQQFRPEFTTAASPAAQEAARRGTTTDLNVDGASHVNPPPQTHKTPRVATINAFKMEVARHLIAFEQAVAEEQANLRARIVGANSEAAGLRADLRLIESDRARWAEGEPVRRPASASPDPENAATPSTSSSTEAADASSPDIATPVDHGTNDNDAITEEEAAEFMDMISAAQQRVLASIASDRELVEALGSEMRDIRQHVTRLQAPT